MQFYFPVTREESFCQGARTRRRVFLFSRRFTRVSQILLDRRIISRRSPPMVMCWCDSKLALYPTFFDSLARIYAEDAFFAMPPQQVDAKSAFVFPRLISPRLTSPLLFACYFFSRAFQQPFFSASPFVPFYGSR